MKLYGEIKRWIGVDLDRTLAYYDDNWASNTNQIFTIGKPLEPMVNRVKMFLEQGYKVKIMTARVCSIQPKKQIKKQRKLVEKWCLEKS